MITDKAIALGRWFVVLYGWWFVFLVLSLVKQAVLVGDAIGPTEGTILYLLLGLVSATLFAIPAAFIRRDLAHNHKLYRFLVICTSLVGLILAAFQPIDYSPSQL